MIYNLGAMSSCKSVFDSEYVANVDGLELENSWRFEF
jgi:hypothetical protein